MLRGKVTVEEAVAAAGRGAAWELAPAAARHLTAYLELIKPRITVLVLLAAMAGFWLGSEGAPDAGGLLLATAGIALLAGGMFALNQYIERDLDAIMRRTENRPLPSARLRPAEALWFGAALSVAAVCFLALAVNPLTGALGFATLAGYTLLYTPLKTRTPHSTLVGAFPGAMPPVVGWAAARGELGAGAWVLFGILFLWQFPHFHSIAWLYREDYGRAGIRMWPVVAPEGRGMFCEIAVSAALLLPFSLLPSTVGLSGGVYLGGAALLGLPLVYLSFETAYKRSRPEAQRLLLASVLYLPALLVLMVLDKA